MADELAAFFAKKTSKGKKKGVIKLQEVADQLEKCGKIQDELDEIEAKAVEESTAKHRATNNNTDNSDDSEWLDFDSKPVMPPVIKEMIDADVEDDEEEKRSGVEMAKSWNINNESTETTPPPQPKEAAKFVPKGMRNQLDINNEMAFPSLDKAEEVEKVQKKEMEEKILIEIEEKRRQEEEQKKMANRYKAVRPQQDGDSPRRQDRKQPESMGPTEADNADTWRRDKPDPQPSIEERPRRAFSRPAVADSEDGKQMEQRDTEADTTNDWRGEQKTRPAFDTTEMRQQRAARSPERQAMRSQIESDAASDWRTVQRSRPPAPVENFTKSPEHRSPVKNTSDENSSWRTAKPKEESPTKMGIGQPMPKEEEAAAPAPKPKQGSYVPPHLRKH